jgi:hypothetical protein
LDAGFIIFLKVLNKTIKSKIPNIISFKEKGVRLVKKVDLTQ